MMKAIALLLSLAIASSARAVEKPNIIVIYADDMGFGDCTVNVDPTAKDLAQDVAFKGLLDNGQRFADRHAYRLSVLLHASAAGLRGVIDELLILDDVGRNDAVHRDKFRADGKPRLSGGTVAHNLDNGWV